MVILCGKIWLSLFIEENSYFRNKISKKCQSRSLKKLKIHHFFKKADILYPCNYIQDQLCIKYKGNNSHILQNKNNTYM